MHSSKNWSFLELHALVMKNGHNNGGGGEGRLLKNEVRGRKGMGRGFCTLRNITTDFINQLAIKVGYTTVCS